MPYSAVVALFNDARSRDYDELVEPLNLLIKDSKTRKKSPESFANQLQKLHQRFQEIRDIDYFQSSRGEDLQRLFQKAESLGLPVKRREPKERLRKQMAGSGEDRGKQFEGSARGCYFAASTQVSKGTRPGAPASRIIDG